MLQLLITLLFLLLFALFLYVLILRRLRRKGWFAAIHEVHDENEQPGFPGGAEKEWLFAGPPANTVQERHLVWAHYSVYGVRVVWILMRRTPAFLWRLLRCSIRDRRISFVHSILAEELYDIFAGGPLLIMSEVAGTQLTVQVPPMPLKTMPGVNPSGLRLVFDSDSRRLVHAEWHGEDIFQDKGLVATLLLMVLNFWAHPQTHIAAERSGREIAQKQVQILEPSNRYVVALHQGLLYGRWSGFTNGQPFSINGDKQKIVEAETTIRMPHNFSPLKLRFRYYRFLLEARKILLRLLREYEIPVSPEWLFNNIIVHSVDHYFFYKNLMRITAWSIDGGTGIYSYWRSQIFLAMWVREVVSPFETEHIGQMCPEKHPFYHQLYRELAAQDAELADCILASTSD